MYIFEHVILLGTNVGTSNLSTFYHTINLFNGK